MKKRLLSLAVLAATALPALCQEDYPDRVDDPEFMEYFDEAYSVYLDGSNRCAGISELTGPEAETVWSAATWGPVDYDLSFDNSVMTVEKTIVQNEKNWASVDLLLTDWKGESGYKFPHIAERAGENANILTGMFVDMSIDGEAVMSFDVRTDTDFVLRVDITDANGRQANGKAPAEYQNSFHEEIYAEDGWRHIEITWSDPMFDFYSQNYWGEENGMGFESNPLWAYDENGEIVTYAVEAERPVPVSMQAICKISIIIDDGNVMYPGDVGETKTVQFKNMVLGYAEEAVPFKAVTDYNIASGAIKYDPSNASLVRARQDIEWGESIYTNNGGNNTAPYIKKWFNDLYLSSDFGYYTFDLNSYFADDESGLDYSVSVINYGDDDIYAYVNEGVLEISKPMNSMAGEAQFRITAYDDEGESVVSTLYVEASNGATTQAYYDVYVTKELPDLYLDQGFGQHTINLDEYFGSESGNIYYWYNDYSYTNSLDVTLSGSRLVLNEGTQTGSVEFFVQASDLNGYGSAEQYFSVTYTGGKTNGKPYIAKPLNEVTLTEGFGATTIDLSRMFADPDGDGLYFEAYVYNYTGNLTSVSASVNGNKLVLSENSIGHTVVEIYVSDGNNDSYVNIEVSVLEKGNKKPEAKKDYVILDFTTGNESAMVDLSSYFTDDDQLTYSLLNEWTESFISGNQLQVNTSESGIDWLYVSANDGRGGEELMLISAFVSEPGAQGPQVTAQIGNVALDVDETKNINYSEYFSWDYGQENFYVTSSNPNVVEPSSNYNGTISLMPMGVGTAEVTAVIMYVNGTHAEQTFTVTVGAVTSADEVEEPELSVFPTVFTETLTVQGAGGSAVTVYTMAGMPVFTLPAISSDETLNLGQLAPGIYFLQVNGKTVPIVKE